MFGCSSHGPAFGVSLALGEARAGHRARDAPFMRGWAILLTSQPQSDQKSWSGSMVYSPFGYISQWRGVVTS